MKDMNKCHLKIINVKAHFHHSGVTLAAKMEIRMEKIQNERKVAKERQILKNYFNL